MATAADDNKTLAQNLQHQFLSVSHSSDDRQENNATTALGMIEGTDRIVGVLGERLLLQAGVPLGGGGGATKAQDNNNNNNEEEEEEEENQPPLVLLDNACGTGAITSLLQKKASPALLQKSRIVCADLNANLVEIVKWRAEKEGWKGTIETAVLDAQDMGLPSNSFTHIIMNYAMHIIPNPNAVLREAYRLLRPNGTLAFTVLAPPGAGWIPDMRSAFAALPFEAPMPDVVPIAVHGLVQWIDPDGIRAELASFSAPRPDAAAEDDQSPSSDRFQDVRIETLEHTTRVDSAEYFVETFGIMRRWVMDSYWSEENRQKAAEVGAAGMDKVMIDHLREKYDGNGWDITWKSILVTCRKPL